jgi:membrane protein DedA with SNARE-associated domain
MPLEISQDLGVWAYFLLAVLVMVEGPVATLAGAIAASAGFMSPGWVFVSASAGNLLADGLWYTLGYMGKIEWLERYGRWMGVKQVLINQVMGDIRTHAAKLLFLAKLTLGFTIPTLVAAGLVRVPLRRWLPSLLLAETLWTGVLVFLGYHFGRYVQTLERGMEMAALVGGLLFIGFILYYLARLRRRSSAAKSAEAASTEKGYL